MLIYSTYVDRSIHEKYMNADHSMNCDFTSEGSWRLIQKTHPGTHLKFPQCDVRAHRTSEIDHCMQRDLTFAAGPYLIRHHINEGIALAKSITDNWDYNCQPICLQGTNMYSICTRWIESLEDRFLPALYGASIEIDPKKVYEEEYYFLRGLFIEKCKEIKQASKILKRSKYSAKNRAFIQQKYKETLEAFLAQLEHWALRALNDLSPWDVNAEN